jgi:hypothetical protein
MVFTYIFESFKTAAVFFLLNDYLKNNYPNQHNDFLLTIFFNVIYVYSYLQMGCMRYASFLFHFTTKKQNSRLEFIKNGEIVVSLSNEKYNYPTDYDFALYWDYECSSYPNVKIIRNNVDLEENLLNYEPSNIKFLLVEIFFVNKSVKCDLSTKNFNFYIKDNIFDISFFTYYLRYLHPEKICLQNNDELKIMEIHIIDDNANITTIDFTKDNSQIILLNKNEYEIISGCEQ